MPLTEDQEQVEHEWRIEQMATQIDKTRLDIEKLRFDMRMDEKKLRFDMQMDEKKLRLQLWGIAISGAGIVIAAFAAGAAWTHYFRP